MTTDDDLHRLLHDAVDDFEPSHRMAHIRAQVQADRPRRSRWLVAGGAVVASAAAVTAIAVVPTLLTGADGPDGPDRQAGPDRRTASATEAPAPTTPGIYFVGDTPRGSALYREFQTLQVDDPLTEALRRSITDSAMDPEYRSDWPASVRVDATYDGELFTIDLSGPGLRDRPGRWSERDAELAVQQVIYTAQAVESDSEAPVRLLLDGEPTDEVFGVPANEPLTRAPELDVRAHVNLSDPSEDATVKNRLRIKGVAASSEANVLWRITAKDGAFMSQDYLTTLAAMTLSPFEGSVDVSDLAPGAYELCVQTDDPSDGEGPGPDVDTRTFHVNR